MPRVGRVSELSVKVSMPCMKGNAESNCFRIDPGLLSVRLYCVTPVLMFFCFCFCF